MATPSYYWAETNCWNSWPREDSSTSSIPRPKLSWQHRKFFRKGKASPLEDICRSGRIHQLSLPLQNLDKLLIQMKKLSQPLRSLSVCHINQEQNLWLLKPYDGAFSRKKQAQSDRLQPTQAALQQAILRADYQLMVWNSDRITNPELLSPQHYGWRMDQEEWVPVMTNMPPAP